MSLARPQLDREQLIELVRDILDFDAHTDEELNALVAEFSENVPHPEASGLIFWSDRYFEPGRMPTPEQIVDKALSYRPIPLGPATT
jgi:hypothetical protein